MAKTLTEEDRDAMIVETNLLTKQTHGAVFGNGHLGLKTRIERAEGAIRMLMLIGTLAGGLGVYFVQRQSFQASAYMAIPVENPKTK